MGVYVKTGVGLAPIATVPVPETTNADVAGYLEEDGPTKTKLIASVGEMAETPGTRLRTVIVDYVATEELGTTDGQAAALAASEASAFRAAENVKIDDRRQIRSDVMRFDPLPGAAYGEVNANCQIYAQDSLHTAPNGDQYAVWWNEKKQPVIGRKAAGTQGWEFHNLASVPGNPLRAPHPADAHNVVTVVVDGAGFIHVFGNMHNHALRYMRSAVANSISGGWDAPAMSGLNESDMSYPAAIRLADGDLLFFFRDGGSGNGNTYVNHYDTPTKTWTRRVLFAQGYEAGDDYVVGESCYLNRVAYDPTADRVHVSYVWRVNPDLASVHDLGYAYSDDHGATWRTAAGAAVTMPIVPTTTSTLVVDADGYAINQCGMALDDAGRPHIVMRPPGAGNMVHWRWDGTAWQSQTFAVADGLYSSTAAQSRPSAVGATDGRVFALWRNNNRLTVRQVHPTLEDSFTPWDYDTPYNEPGYDGEAARGDSLQMIASHVTATTAPSWVGVLTLDLTAPSVTVLRRGTATTEPPPEPAIAAPESIYRPRTHWPMVDNLWYAPAGVRVTGSSAPLMPTSTVRGCYVSVPDRHVKIYHAAARVEVVGDAGSRFRILLIDPTTGRVFGRSNEGVADSSANTTQELAFGSTWVGAPQGGVMIVALHLYGGTAGVKFLSTAGSDSDPNIGYTIANSMMQNAYHGVGWSGITDSAVTSLSMAAALPNPSIPTIGCRGLSS